MKKILFLLGVLALSAASSSPSLATGGRGIPQDNYARPSSWQDIGMMFYKLIGGTPPFDVWIDTSPAYLKMNVEEQTRFKDAELPRLRAAFARLDLSRTPIVVRASVRTEIVSKPATVPGQPPVNMIKIDFAPDRSVYFPYLVAGQTIAVIPNGIDLYREIPLTDREATAIRARHDVGGMTTLVLEISPRIADGRAPVMMDGESQWLLIGEIGFIGLYNSSAEVLWSYQAPGYMMQGQDALLKLRPDGATIPPKPGP